MAIKPASRERPADDRSLLLKRHGCSAGLTDDEIQRIAADCELLQLEMGEVLHRSQVDENESPMQIEAMQIEEAGVEPASAEPFNALSSSLVSISRDRAATPVDAFRP